MKIAYLDCLSGMAGDMMLGALVDAGVDLGTITAGIDSLGLPDVRLVAETVKRHGFRATKVHVSAAPEQKHRHLHHIVKMIDASIMTPRQRELATRIFTRLGEAEAKVHGSTLEKVHFHEVGAADSIADICGTAIGWDLLGAERLLCSPVPTGSGFIEIAHGRCSIPAPATAELLRGIPLASNPVESELTTPTGAAIIATLASGFGPLPPMSIQQIGYGAGDRDFKEQANIVRLLVGVADGLSDGAPADGSVVGSGAAAAAAETADQIVVLETNLDDVSGEVIGYCLDRLWQAGAYDVYTTAITMKKNRPATKITILAPAARQALLQEILVRETGTLGVRSWVAQRTKLPRSVGTVQTPWGEVTVKRAVLPGGGALVSPEYESCRQLAELHGIPLEQVYATVRQSRSL